MRASLLLLILSSILCSAFAVLDQQPQQVHLSLGKDATEMMVTWLTVDPITVQPVVEYGLADSYPLFPFTSNGWCTKFTDGGSEQRVMYIHRVLLRGLTPGAGYYYHTGGPEGWSDVFWFSALKEGTNWSPRFAIFGDLGNVNGQSIPRLQQEVARGAFDAILHVGDIAYDLDTDNARVGDEFMRQIEPIAAYVPYQTVVGNHEEAYNFSNYDARFTMTNMKTGGINNHFYSFNVGPVHFISFSTEYYFFVNYGWTQIANQFRWLEEDLAEANKPENRAVRPWIITMGHRPMYCSTDDQDDCRNKESIVRRGLPILHAYGLEDLFYKHGVDIEIYGHEHTYERMFPVYNQTVYNGSLAEPYTNPKAPIHIITGSAGCQERIDQFIKNPPAWSAVRISDYGYTRLHVENGTHLHLEQVSDDKNGMIADRITVVKTRHGSYA